MTPRRHRCFYGWAVVVASGVAIITSFPGNTFGIAFFLPHVQRDLALSPTHTSFVWAAAITITAAFLPLAGTLVDKQGPWRVMLTCVPGIVLSLVSLSFCEAWYTLLLAIAALRFFGIGCLYVATTAAANRWFVRKRGRVSIVLIVFFYSMLALPGPTQALIEAYGWRVAYRIIAGICGGVLASTLLVIRDSPLTMGLLPDGDGDGLSAPGKGEQGDAKNGSLKQMSGGGGGGGGGGGLEMTAVGPPPEMLPEAAPAAASEALHNDESSFTAGQAVSTTLFWVMASAVWVTELYWVAANYNVVALLGANSTRAKLDDSAVLGVLGVACVASAVASMGAGIGIERMQHLRRRRHQQCVNQEDNNDDVEQQGAGDDDVVDSGRSTTKRRRPLRREKKARKTAQIPHRRGLLLLVALQMLVTAASSVLVVFASNLGMAVIWALLFAAMIGIQDVIMLSAFAEVFGSKHIGSIMGVVTCIMTVATALGPVLGALCVADGGAPELFFLPVAATSLLLCVLCFVVPDPVKGEGRACRRRCCSHCCYC